MICKNFTEGSIFMTCYLILIIYYFYIFTKLYNCTYPPENYNNTILKERRIKVQSVWRSTANKGNPIFQTNFLNDFKQSQYFPLLFLIFNSKYIFKRRKHKFKSKMTMVFAKKLHLSCLIECLAWWYYLSILILSCIHVLRVRGKFWTQ